MAPLGQKPRSLIEALRRRHRDGVVLVEALGRIDALVFEPDGRRVAYEVKTSADDFRSELRRPEKRGLALELAHEFWFAAPAALACKVAGLVPRECGLVAIDQTLRSFVLVEAPGLSPREPTGAELTALLRHRMRPAKVRRLECELQRVRGRERLYAAEIAELSARAGLTPSGTRHTLFAVN